MERALFDWEDLGEFAYHGTVFKRVTLRQQLGEYSAGTKFASVKLDYRTGVLSLCDDSGKIVVSFLLQLTVWNWS